MEVNSTAAYFSQCTDAVPSGNILDFSYGYNLGTANNGNVASWSALGNQTFTRSYGYDSLNRLSTMSDTATAQACKGLSWTVDPWGNLTDQTVTSGSCLTLHVGVGTNNRLLSPYQYDAAGNMTSDATHTYTYDAENRLTLVDGGNAATYLYDAEGHRVQKTAAATGVNAFIYGTDGNIIADVSGTGDWNTGYVYLGGSLIAQYRDSTTYSIFRDHLSSTRLITKLDKSVYDSLDFLPFGVQTAGDTGTTHKFTGKERDSESNLDNFAARYFTSNLGRFTSPDPDNAGADTANPQSWNAYSYVLNNPLNATDPNGLWCAYLNDAGTGLDDKGIDNHSNSGECNQNGGYWIEGDFGAASLNMSVDVDNGTVTGVGYGANANPLLSTAGAMGSNQWGAWTQTYVPGNLNWANTDVPSIVFRRYWINQIALSEQQEFLRQYPNFQKYAQLGGAIAGQAPDTCGPINGNSAPTDSTKETEGQKSAQVYVYGPDGKPIGPLKYKNNKPVAPNPKGAKMADAAQAPGNAVAWAAGISDCLGASSRR